MPENDDFIQYCMSNYKVPFYALNEFKNDMSTVTNIKKMLSRYLTSNKINERLILNHVITLNNVFGIEATNIILFYKLEKKFYPAIKSILIFLNIYTKSSLTIFVEKDEKLHSMFKRTS